VIGFAGLSHLGIVSSLAAAERGSQIVRAYDPDSSLCDELQRGELSIEEPGLEKLLKKNASKLKFDSDLRVLVECDIIYLSMDVPTDSNGRSELSKIRQLIEDVTSVASPGTVLILLSQVPPGFTRKLASELILSNDRELQLFYQVETLIFGRAVERALHPERIIVGCLDKSAPLPSEYRQFLDQFKCPVLPMRYESAELTKIAINMFLISSLSTTNMLAGICEVIGAEWNEIAPALRLDERIGPHAYLSPGLGIGGTNLIRDLTTLRLLAKDVGVDVEMVDSWLNVSHNRRDWVLRIISNQVLSQAGTPNPLLAVLGLTYKPHTNSTANSPALSLITQLNNLSFRGYDPCACIDESQHLNLKLCDSPVEACRGADAVLVMTPWPEFSEVNIKNIQEVMHGRVLIDPFGILSIDQCEALNLSYFRLGSKNDGVVSPVN